MAPHGSHKGRNRGICPKCGKTKIDGAGPPVAIPKDRRPPPCPVPGCGKERNWWGVELTTGKPRAACKDHVRVLSDEEARALMAGKPYPKRRDWNMISKRMKEIRRR